MIIHIVLFDFNQAVSEETVDGVLNDIKVLKEKIPGILRIVAGKNIANLGKNRRYSHGLLIECDSSQSLRAYFNHPEHQFISKERLLPILSEASDSSLVMDIVC